MKKNGYVVLTCLVALLVSAQTLKAQALPEYRQPPLMLKSADFVPARPPVKRG